jgi:ABC-2 type transport system permease protein
VFYSIDLLGQPWRSISLVNPILYMVNAFRYGVLGVSDVQIGVAFVVMIAFVVGLSAVALVLLKRGVGMRS